MLRQPDRLRRLDRHLGVVNVGKLPVSLAVPEENLSFPAPGGNKTSVLAQGSAEVPVEFNYSRVAMRLDGNSLDFEFTG